MIHRIAFMLLAFCFITSTVGAGYQRCAMQSLALQNNAMAGMENCHSGANFAQPQGKMSCCDGFSCPKCFSPPLSLLSFGQPETKDQKSSPIMIMFDLASHSPPTPERPPKIA